MSRVAEDVGFAVAVDVISEHIGAGVAELGWVELPRSVVELGRLLPPTGGADHVEPAVTVDIASTQTVSKTKRTGNDMAFGAWLADGVHVPQLSRVCSRGEKGHLTFILFALGLPTHQQDALAIAEQINVSRCFIAGAVPDHVFFPVTLLALRIFIPVTRCSRETDHNQVRPSVAVEVVGPTGKGTAVDIFVAFSVVVFAGANPVRLPVGCLIP